MYLVKQSGSKVLQQAHWGLGWVEWNTEYDGQVSTNKYNDYVAITEVNRKCCGERKGSCP